MSRAFRLRRRTARRYLALPLTIAGVLVTSGCGLFGSSHAANDALNGFLAALSSGDTAKAAAATDDPSAAKPVLDQVRSALRPKSIKAAVDHVDPGDSSTMANGAFTISWDLGGGRVWRYDSTAQLHVAEDGGDSWQVHWAPSVLHPKLATGQTIALRVQPAQPGSVMGSDGSPILSAQQVISVLLTPSKAGDLKKVAGTLAGALSRYDKSITAQSIVDGSKSVPDGDDYLVASLRQADYQRAKPAIYALPGVHFDANTRLLPPQRGFGSMVVPRIQSAVADKVSGHDGWSVVALDASGNVASELYAKPMRPGTSVSSTLDTRVQRAADAAVAPIAKPAVIVAMRPSTGEILAVAQNSAADKQGSIALTGRYPPGSTFKMVTAVAALSSGAVTPDTKENCPGTIRIGDRLIPNDNHFNKGVVPLHLAFAYSCNTTFAHVASGLDDDALTNAANQLGVGLDFDIPGITTITGSVPPAADTTELAEDGFGQGKDLVSPFGLALVAATIKSGTVPTPTLIAGEHTKVNGQPQPIPSTVLASMRSMMRDVITYGTGGLLRSMPNVAGKTGTAQYGDGSTSHAWFAGFDGDLAFATLEVGGGESTAAIKITKRFLTAIGG
ncbi:MAG: penicillin-binding protein [Sciscionella sp.]|nr:penicillin-binding protein [Sciscionella sp.]